MSFPSPSPRACRTHRCFRKHWLGNRGACAGGPVQPAPTTLSFSTSRGGHVCSPTWVPCFSSSHQDGETMFAGPGWAEWEFWSSKGDTWDRCLTTAWTLGQEGGFLLTSVFLFLPSLSIPPSPTKLNQEAETVTKTPDDVTPPSPCPLSYTPCPEAEPQPLSLWKLPHSQARRTVTPSQTAWPNKCLQLFLEFSSYAVSPAAPLKPVPIRILSF